MKYKLAPVTEGKIINSNYPSTSHLPGSKMIDDEDRLIAKVNSDWMQVKTKNPSDIVIVTEKIDGMNCGVYKKDNLLYPLTRKGYDARTNDNDWIRSFARYVEDNADRFGYLLEDGERICGEWMIKTHTLKYKLKGEPFIAFDIIRDYKRNRYIDFISRVNKFDIEHTGIVHIGTAIDVPTALKLLDKGFHGQVDGEPEGVVYKYETVKDGLWFTAKFVANQKLGKEGKLKTEDSHAYNIVRKEYRKYYHDEDK